MSKNEAKSKPTSKPNKGNAGSTSLKELEKKRRQVFKPVLDNPFTQSNLWPFIEPELATNIIDLLEIVLSPIGQHSKMVSELKDKSKCPPKPEICNEITIGFNSTVSTLEKQAQTRFKRRKTSTNKFLNYVFVTKYDIAPSVLTSFFPTLTVTASNEQRVKLIQLPRGTMDKLSKFVNKENVGIIGMTSNVAGASSLYKIIDENVTDVDIPWLSGLFDEEQKFVKPSLKHILTSAPIIPKKNVQKKTASPPKEDKNGDSKESNKKGQQKQK
mgnify:CR=1 FL=1|jgi:ribonuclease P/MRP protein subunit POP3